MPAPCLIAFAVGNTRVRFGLFRGCDLDEARSAPADAVDEVIKAVMTFGSAQSVPAVVASVNAPASDVLTKALVERAGLRVLRIGSDVPIPLRHRLDDASTLGQDRALCALAAYKRAEQACVVVDAGTAVTVDFIDGEGVFQGGVIAPGLQMMLDSLHERTAALPSIRFERPDASRGPFGLDTRHAMLLGATNAVRGLVRETIEQFASAYGAYPQIIATGGDAGALFDGDDLIEHIVPDLQLFGIADAFAAASRDE
jgi:type III pantothenate kinase